MENINYYLVLEKRRGEHIVIDINKLDLCKFSVTNQLESIDTFTKEHTEQEIKDSILRSNMADLSYLSGKLRIISDLKHNLDIVTKDVFQNVFSIISNEIEIDKDFKNKIFTFYKNLIDGNFNDHDFKCKMIDRFKKELKSDNFANVFSYVAELPYQKIRPLYINVSKEIDKIKESKIKKLEKLNDVA